MFLFLVDPAYYAFDGCSTNLDDDFEGNAPGYYHGKLEGSHISCCTLTGDSCSREAHGGNCRSGDKVTWEVAREHCEVAGMRLCNSEEELDQCCGTGCNYDNILIWSSITEGMLLITLFYL